DFHCIAPDLMGLGDTEVDPKTTRFDMASQAEMLIEVMATLGYDEFAIVCHDQGGAAAQHIAANVPQRITALVLTDCVCYDNWPVPVIRRLQSRMRSRFVSELIARGHLGEWVETRTRLSAFRRGVYEPRKLSDDAIREYLRPLRTHAGRERFRQFLLAGDSRYTQLAVDGLRRFEKPTFVIWAAEDRYLSPSWGQTLADDIPGAVGVRLVPFCGHFWQEERPAEFASHIGAFLTEHLADRVVEGDGAVRRGKPVCAGATGYKKPPVTV
ncbi:MAG: alpha/beta hydrolase, partial [Deltaproteobacteria bacterium]